jgi:heat shock protein HslJ
MTTRIPAALIKAGLVAALLISACAVFSPASTDPLEGTSWRLTSYDGKQPIPGRNVTVTFSNGSMRGSAGCNSFQGKYQVQGRALTFNELAATEMACLEPDGIMQQEQAVLGFLREADAFERQGKQLHILRADDAVLVFERAE